MMDSGFFRAELHCHTVYSYDGHIPVSGMQAMARQRGIRVIAITDHDTIEGALEFRRYFAQHDSGLHIIVGEERTLSDKSHVIGLFLREPIRSDTLPSAIEEIQRQNGVCVLPHPLRRKDGTCRDGRPHLSPGQAGFEIFNPKCGFEENTRARDLLDAGWTAVGGSDAHFDSDIGECVNVVRFQTDLETSIRLVLSGAAPCTVLGIRQQPGDSGRRYAPFYYKIKPYIRVPRSLLPAANSAYTFFRRQVHGRRPPALEVKHGIAEGLGL